MRGRPTAAFKEHPKINDAYTKMRPRFIQRLEHWNAENPKNKVSQENIPLMEFIRSCIPKELDPPPLGSDTKNIRGRMRDILYPFLEGGHIDPKSFAEWISDSARMTRFLKEWLANKKPRRASRPQPKPQLKALIGRGIIPSYARLRLRFDGNTYEGSITANGGIQIDLGGGFQLFKSPNEVLAKGLKATNRVAWDYFFLVDDQGNETLLRELRNKYLQVMGLLS